MDFYIVVEASYTSGNEDLDRVLISADVLRRVFPDTEVVPTLYFALISDADLEAAETAKVVTTTES